jgi:hypothetical protein
MDYKIQIPGELTDLLPLFGIVGPVFEWKLNDTVLPVALVNSQVTLSSTATPLLYTTTQSAGETAAPAANTRLVNTGQLNSGNYAFRISITSLETNSYRIRIRNAADAADIWSSLVGVINTDTLVWDITWTLAQNERLVVENVGAGAVNYQARVFYTTI